MSFKHGFKAYKKLKCLKVERLIGKEEKGEKKKKHWHQDEKVSFSPLDSLGKTINTILPVPISRLKPWKPSGVFDE